MIQPIVARPVRGAPDAFEIIAGERRWRAAQRAGLHEVPVVIIEATTRKPCSLPSSRTCSVPTLIRSKRRRATVR